MSRTLPDKRNPLLPVDVAPTHEELLERRRLGRTKLSVKPGQINTSNATKSENLGPVEYAHLRAPLPEDLAGSEIFAPQAGQPHPQTYFLMRRSRDGFVSATGMFKIAFPWARHAEERAEREHLKTLESTSSDEIAGNVWITPSAALELAEEYGLTHWINALLDPEEISPSPTSARKNIAAPPKFEKPIQMKDIKLSPPATVTKNARGRGTRSLSPGKGTPSAKAKASPRKRQTKKEKEANIAHANAASASLQSALDDAASGAEATPTPEPSMNEIDVEDASVNASDVLEAPDAELEPVAHEDSMVRVEVDQEVEVNGETEITHTNVTVEMPLGLPNLPPPEDTEAMLAQAKQMVEEARALEGSPKQSRKRRIEEVEVEVEPTDIDGELPVQPVKRARILEDRYKREQVRTRAVFGVAASLAIAAAIPFLQTFF